MSPKRTKRPVTAKEMKSYDNYTIEKIGVPSMVLMEHAAIASVEVLNESFDLKKVLCVASAGNNGGDAFAVARLLFLKGIDVEILFLGNRDKCSTETTQQYKICENYNIRIYDNDLNVISKGGYTVIIDGIFGIGLDRNIEGKYKETIDKINEVSQSGETKVLALDIPSGLLADTGEVMGTSVRANKTVTFAYNKVGMTVKQGPKHAGEVIVKDIGIYMPEDLKYQYITSG